MSVFRAFIAVDLPAEIHRCLDQISAGYQEMLGDSPVRWVPAENIHLTLKFLGDVSVASTEMLTKILETMASNHHTFEISIGGAGAFPNARRPRVLWVGVEAPPDLMSMQRSIDQETARMGYASEERPFSPHLTIGRVSRNAPPRDIRAIGQALESKKVGFLGAARVKQVHLFRSDLKPGGAVYTKVFSASLQER